MVINRFLINGLNFILEICMGEGMIEEAKKESDLKIEHQ